MLCWWCGFLAADCLCYPPRTECLETLYDMVVQACVRAGKPAAALCIVSDLRWLGIRSPTLFHSIVQAQVRRPRWARLRAASAAGCRAEDASRLQFKPYRRVLLNE